MRASRSESAGRATPNTSPTICDRFTHATAPLAQVPGVTLFSLQKGPGRGAACVCGQRLPGSRFWDRFRQSELELLHGYGGRHAESGSRDHVGLGCRSIWPPCRWACRSGWRSAPPATGDGLTTARTAPGIRPCGSFAKSALGNGTSCFLARIAGRTRPPCSRRTAFADPGAMLSSADCRRFIAYQRRRNSRATAFRGRTSGSDHDPQA